MNELDNFALDLGRLNVLYECILSRFILLLTVFILL